METCCATETLSTEGESSCVCDHEADESNPQMAIIKEKRCGSDIVAPVKPKEVVKSMLEWTKDDHLPSWSELTGEPFFNLGIVVNEATTTDIHLSSIGKPASSCEVKSLVVLQATQQNGTKPRSILKEWLEANSLESNPEEISVGFGEQGFEELIHSPGIQAVYIILPPG